MKLPRIMSLEQGEALRLAIEAVHVEQDMGSLRDLAWMLGDLRRIGVAYKSGSEVILRYECVNLGLDPAPYFERMYEAMGAWPSGVRAPEAAA